MFKRWVVYLSSLFGGLLLIGGVLGALVWVLISARLPSLDVLTDYQPKLPLRVLSEEGITLAEFGEERRSLVKLADVPMHVRREAIGRVITARAVLLQCLHHNPIQIAAKQIDEFGCIGLALLRHGGLLGGG